MAGIWSVLYKQTAGYNIIINWSNMECAIQTDTGV